MDLYSATFRNIVLLGIILPVVFGRPQLTSSIGLLELSGEQCPGTLTLTCDARNFGASDTINWFVGDERIFLFDANTNSTPLTGTTTRPDLLNATVQLTSVMISGNQSSFVNFTLSASVRNFVSLQGQNISCGNLAPEGRSSQFGIRAFTEINESTSYQDHGEIEVVRFLSVNSERLRIRWIISDSRCEGTVFNFRVFLTYSTISDNRTVHCSSICEVFFPLSSAVNQYVVDVWAINNERQLVRKLPTINITERTTLNSSSSHILQHSACEATFMCTSEIDGECVFEIIRNDINEHRRRSAVNSPVIFSNLMPNTLYFYRINITSLQPILIIENNFTTNKGSCGSPSSMAVIVGVVVPVLILVLVLVVVVILIFLVTKCKSKKVERSSLNEVDGIESENIPNIRGIPAVVVVGRQRSGKASALNEIFEMDSFKSSISPGSVTYGVISKEIQKDNERLTVFSTPGLSAADLNMDEVIPQMKRAVANVRFVLIYVFDINKLPEIENKKMVENIHSAFGKNVWQSSIILLTFCDECEHLEENEFKNHLRNVASSLEDLLRECRADFECIKTVFEIDLDNNENKYGEITAIPVGYKHTSEIRTGLQPNLEWQDLALFEIRKKVPKEPQKKFFNFIKNHPKSVSGGAGAGVGAVLGALVGMAGGPVGAVAGVAGGSLLGGLVGGLFGHMS